MSVIAEVIKSVRERECEARDLTGRWYSLRVRPYFTLDNKVDGAVMVLLDIDALKRSEQFIAAARDYAEAIVRSAPDPMLILNSDLFIQTCSEAFYRTFSVTATESEGRLIYDLGNGQWNIPRLHHLLGDILPRNSVFNDLEITHEFASIGRRTMLLNARTMSETADQPARILLGIHDITERSQMQEALRASHAELRSHAAELERFNRVAVGRELRMVALKQEINELRRQQGEAARYPLEFEREAKDTDD